jgi:hypothetical protein
MGMCMSNLRNERKQHSEQDYSNIGLGQALVAWVGIHIANRVIVRMRRSCLGH